MRRAGGGGDTVSASLSIVKRELGGWAKRDGEFIQSLPARAPNPRHAALTAGEIEDRHTGAHRRFARRPVHEQEEKDGVLLFVLLTEDEIGHANVKKAELERIATLPAQDL